MCGIFIVICEEERGINIHKANSALRKVNHRGPDSKGADMLNDGKLFMGHALLRISGKTVDASLQPMTSQSGRYTMVYNGEIYNVDQIKSITPSIRPHEANICDSSILLEYIDAYGLSVNTINSLDGMFSFCIYDREEKRIVLVRDHVGIKPLYRYRSNDGKTLCYASEIKTFIEYFGKEVVIAQDKIGELLRFKYVAAPYTVWSGVEHVKAGHMESVAISDGIEVKEESWYQPRYIGNWSLDERISRSLEMQLSAEALRGLQLSGGLDSTLLYEIAVKRNRLATFSAVFPGFECSEEKYIEEVRRRNSGSLEHHEVRIYSDNFYSDLTEATRFLDEPIVHQHTIAIAEIARQAQAAGTRVMISGEGADELFAGYHWQDNYHKCNIENVYDTQFLTEKQMKMFTSDENVKNSGRERELTYCKLKGHNVNLQYEVQTHLQNLLMRQDRMMMRYSVENRVPFLGRLVFDYAYSEDDSSRYTLNKGKEWIKESIIARGYSETFARRKKIGFRLPYNIWNEEVIGKRLEFYAQKKDLLDFLSVSGSFLQQCAKGEVDIQYDSFKFLWLLEAAEAFVNAFDLL